MSLSAACSAQRDLSGLDARPSLRCRGYVPTLDDAAPLVQAPPFSDMFGFDGASVLNTSRSSPSKVQQAVTVSAADVGKILGFRGATQQAMEARTGAHIFVQVGRISVGV